MFETLNKAERALLVLIAVVTLIIILWVLWGSRCGRKKCQDDSDCSGSSVCNQGKCVECVFDSDCACTTDNCVDGLCKPSGIPPQACATNCSLERSTLQSNYYPVPVISPHPAIQRLTDGGAQASGKVIVCSSRYVFRYNTDGTFDLTFGASGGGRTNVTDPILKLEVGPDDSIYVSTNGSSTSATARLTIVKLTPNGAFDGTWGTGGYGRIPNAVFGSAQTTYAYRILSDGSIIGVTENRYLFKFLPSGSVDGSFGVGGALLIPGASGSAYNVDHDANYLYIMYELSSSESIVVKRYAFDGTLDLTYGVGGEFSLNPSADGYTTCLANGNNSYAGGIGPDGSFWLVGTIQNYDFGTCNNWPLYVAKILPNGTLDLQFANNGVFIWTSAPNYTQGIYMEALYGLVFNPCNGNMVVGVQNYAYAGNHDWVSVLELTPEGVEIPHPEIIGPLTDTYVYVSVTIPHPSGKLLLLGSSYTTGPGYKPLITALDCFNVKYLRQARPW